MEIYKSLIVTSVSMKNKVNIQLILIKGETAVCSVYLYWLELKLPLLLRYLTEQQSTSLWH